MSGVFISCDVTGYIDGTIQRVAPEQDGIGARIGSGTTPGPNKLLWTMCPVHR